MITVILELALGAAVGAFCWFIGHKCGWCDCYESDNRILAHKQQEWDDQREALKHSLRIANDDCNSLAAENRSLKDLIETYRGGEVRSIIGMLPGARLVSRREFANGKPPCEA